MHNDNYKRVHYYLNNQDMGMITHGKANLVIEQARREGSKIFHEFGNDEKVKVFSVRDFVAE